MLSLKYLHKDVKYQGDQLVGRMDSRLERPSKTLIINGLWLEEDFQADDDFAAVLTCGLENFARFLEAESINIISFEPRKVIREVKKSLKSAGMNLS